MTLQEELNETRRMYVLLVEKKHSEIAHVTRKWEKKLQRLCDRQEKLIALLQAEEDQQKK